MEQISELCKIDRLEKENYELESALLNAQARIVALESLIKIVEEYHDLDFAKTYGSRQLSEMLERTG